MAHLLEGMLLCCGCPARNLALLYLVLLTWQQQTHTQQSHTSSTTFCLMLGLDLPWKYWALSLLAAAWYVVKQAPGRSWYIGSFKESPMQASASRQQSRNLRRPHFVHFNCGSSDPYPVLKCVFFVCECECRDAPLQIWYDHIMLHTYIDLTY